VFVELKQVMPATHEGKVGVGGLFGLKNDLHGRLRAVVHKLGGSLDQG